MADTKISAETAAGTLDGTEIVPVVRASGSPATYSNLRTTAQAIADLGGGGGGGLWAPALVTPPTQSLFTGGWINQGGATATDDDDGIVMNVPSSASHSIRQLSLPAPTPPYSRRALVGVDGYLSAFAYAGIGWTDGTKLHTIAVMRGAANQGAVEVASWTNATTFSSANFGALSPISNPLWLGIDNDGTNISFLISENGKLYSSLFSDDIATAFMANYNTIIFFGNVANSRAGAAILYSFG